MATPLFAPIGISVALKTAAEELIVAEAVDVAFVTFMIGKLLVPTAEPAAAPVSRSV